MSDEGLVVVTGAARGIGRALAEAFGAQGRRVLLTARSSSTTPSKALPGTLEEATEAVNKAGGKASYVRGDLSTEEGVNAVIEAIEAAGGCEVLINNAAVSFVGDFLSVPARRWNPVAAVNLLAPVFLTHAILPGMLERKSGSIVNVSSGAAVSDEVPQLPYAATKAALERLTVGLGVQYAKSGVNFYGVRVDELVPTEAVTYSMPDGLPDIPICPAEDLADAIVTLLTRPELTGQVIGHGRLRELGILRAPSAVA
jgi:NAD(P)-dependent dehydrogenase (short-subunit alcohol dehydrogenase family)